MLPNHISSILQRKMVICSLYHRLVLLLGAVHKQETVHKQEVVRKQGVARKQVTVRKQEVVRKQGTVLLFLRIENWFFHFDS